MEKEEYIPGTCNIGAEEVAIRKTTFIITLVAVLALIAYNFFSFMSVFGLGILFIASNAMAISFLQYRNRFCIKYGWLFQYNFGKRGLQQNVFDVQQRKSDRKKVIEIIAKSILFSTVLVTAVYFLLTVFY